MRGTSTLLPHLGCEGREGGAKKAKMSCGKKHRENRVPKKSQNFIRGKTALVQSHHSTNHSGRSVWICPAIPIFVLFRVSEGSHLVPGATSSLRSDAEPEDELEADRSLFPEAVSTSLLDNTWDGDAEDGMLPELLDNPGTTRGAKLSVLQTFSSHLWSTVAFDRWPTQSIPGLRTAYPVGLQAFPRVIRFKSWANISASSWVFSCPSLLSFLIMCTDAAALTTSSRSGLFEASAGIALPCLAFRVLELVNIFRHILRCFAGASFLVQGLLMWYFPWILAPKDHAHETHTLV